MTNKECVEHLKKLKVGIVFMNTLVPNDADKDTIDIEALDYAIKALKHEVYWEDVKQALNDWLNNISSPQTALNEIYRAYMGKGEENE